MSRSSLSHRQVQKSLTDYLEGDLTLERRARFDAHLEICDDCARDVEEMQQTIRALRSMPDPEPPPMISANVMRRIRAGETHPGFLTRLGRSLGGVLEPGFVLPASAVAVAALVVIAVQGPEGWVGLGDTTANAPAEMSGAVGPLAAIRPPGASVRGEAPFRFSDGSLGGSFGREVPASARVVRTADSAANTSGQRTSGQRTSGPLWRLQIERMSPSGVSRYPSLPLTPRVSGIPGPMVVADRAGAGGSARQAAQPLAMGAAGSPFASADTSSGGEDRRDVWLGRAFADPVAFAQYIGEQSLAEQEHWVRRLADRADARGLLADLVETLRATRDETALWLADDFAAEQRNVEVESGISGSPTDW